MRIFYNSILASTMLFICMFFFSNNANATHVAGGYIEFINTGTPGTYTVKLTLYRDCSGIQLNTNGVKVKLKNSCNNTTINLNMNYQSKREVSQVCAADVGNTTCSGGSVHGYEEYTFTATVTLSPTCNSWTADYSLSARNSTTNIPGSSGTYFHVSTSINTATNNTNTTPTVTTQPEPYVCINQPAIYNLGASEPDGHIITYSLVPATNQNGTNLTYGAGYSASSPIPGASIDPNTGAVSYTPTSTGAFIFVIKMTEKDSLGNIISETNYEYQTFVINCNNQQPSISPTDPTDPNNPFPGGVTNPTGSMTQTGATSLTMCQGLQGCFDILLKDDDTADQIIVTSNILSVMPGATITETGTNPKRLHICWTPVSISGNVTLSFLIKDNACPITGINNFATNINVIKPGVVSTSITPETCVGDADGKINFTVTGGDPITTYSISGPTNATNTTGQFNNLPSGNYTYIINTTTGSCPLTGNFTINPGTSVTLTSSKIDVLCNGGTTGSATVNPNGVAPFSYLWSQGGTAIGQTTQTASNLAAGTYSVLVTDNKGCKDSISIIVGQPTALIGSLTPTNLNCNADASGAISITGTSGGTTPYQYNIDGGSYGATTNFTGLTAGNHTIKIKDNNGCVTTLNSTLTEPSILGINLGNIGNTTCGNNSGSITVSGSGGTAPYQFTDGTTTNSTGSFTNIPSGAHVITITDAKGCSKNLNVNVGAASVPTAYIDTKQDLLCFGGNTGSAVIGVNNGVGSITYSLNGGTPQASNTFTNLSQGSYTVDITDGNGCVAAVSFTINQPPILQYTFTTQDATCNGNCDGIITITATGGTGAYSYSVDNGITFSNSSILTNLCAGNILTVVKDVNGCQSNATAVIGQPGNLSGTITGTDPLCNKGADGKITITGVTGGTPTYQYNVDGGTFQAGNILTGLSAGNHTISIQDANGCSYTNSVTLINPPGLGIVTDFSKNSNCGFNDGSITVHGTGVNAPFTYAMGGAVYTPPTSLPWNSTGVFNNYAAGAYKMYVQDGLGCIDSSYVGINDTLMAGMILYKTDLTCYESNDGVVSVVNTAGAPPINFEIDNNPASIQTNGNFNGLHSGSHIITIYDAGLCIFTLPFSLIQPDSIDFKGNIANVNCFGGSDGTITIHDTIGGNGDYQFSMDWGATMQTAPFTGLTAGDYDVMVFDSNSCSALRTFHIDQADSIQFNTNNIDLVCNNDNSGGVQVVGTTGGTGNYQYSINGGVYQTSPSFFGLSAGTYTLSVLDANVAGCSVSMNATINQPSNITANYIPTGATCFNDCDGQIAIVATGGTPTYLYSKDGGTTYTTSSTLTGLCAGNYTLAIKDDHGCIITSPTQTIIEPNLLLFESDSIQSTCSNANGQINITSVTGGTPGYTYSINNGTYGNNTNFTGLSTNNSPYTLSVKDSRGCTATGTQILTDQAAPKIDLLEGTNPLCNGDANGQVVATVSGGTGTISFSIDGGAYQASNILTGLTAGNHTVTIQDANGCTDTKAITLTEPILLSMTSSAIDLTCFQNSTGKIDIVANGGTTPYQYSFDNGITFGASSQNNFINAGTYNMTVRDANGCEVTSTQIVNEPPILAFNSINVTDALCKSSCNGVIQLNMTGGTGAYNYSWSQSSIGNTNTANGLCTGTYLFTVTDINGCTIDSSAFVDEPDSVKITNIATTAVTCNASCDGTITISSPTATDYSINNGATFQNTNTFNNLCANNYIIVAKDMNGCIVIDSANIWQPDPMNLTMFNDTTVCYAFNFENGVQVSGGIQPYNYNWTNSSSTTDSLNFIATTTQSYSLSVTDVNGCTVPQQTVTISVLPQVTLTVLKDTTICPGGTAILTAQGNQGLPAYSYSWGTGNAADTLNTLSVSPTVATTYVATVKDQCGQTATASVFVDLHSIPQVSFTADNLTGCIPSTVHFTNTTNPADVGTNCTWTIDGQTMIGCSGIDYTFNDDRCYDVKLEVTSPFGCKNDTTYINYICIDAYPIASFYYNPLHPTTVNNQIDFTNTSIGAESYMWNFSDNTSSIDLNPKITFSDVDKEQDIVACLKAISQYGCVDTTCQTIQFNNEFNLYVPNTFTPDGDQYNNVFKAILPPDINYSSFHMILYNRWGEAIFESYNPNVGWDGTYRGAPSPDGTYIWKIKIRFGEKQEIKDFIGHVTLLK